MKKLHYAVGSAIISKLILGFDHENQYYFVTSYIHKHPKHETIKDFRKEQKAS